LTGIFFLSKKRCFADHLPRGGEPSVRTGIRPELAVKINRFGRIPPDHLGDNGSIVPDIHLSLISIQEFHSMTRKIPLLVSPVKHYTFFAEISTGETYPQSRFQNYQAPALRVASISGSGR
jgi:hypothetical protein